MMPLSQAAQQPTPEEQPMPEQQEQPTQLSEEQELDADIAYGLLASMLLEQESVDSIRGLAKAQNPATPVAAMISAVVKELVQNLEGSDMQIDPNVWLADQGAVDRAIDLVSDISGGMPEEVKGAIFSDIVDQVKLMAGGEGQGGQPPMGGDPMQQQQPPMGPPPMPMGGMQ